MKKLPYILVALLIVLAACAAPTPSGQEDASVPTAPAGTVTLSGGEVQPVYYGTFRLGSCVFAPVSGLSVEEARRYLGATVTYAADGASNSLGESCADPGYREQTVTAEDFSAGYSGRLAPEDVNLPGGELTGVTLENAELFGRCFYIRDADSLVIPLDGVFFLAQRVES